MRTFVLGKLWIVARWAGFISLTWPLWEALRWGVWVLTEFKRNCCQIHPDPLQSRKQERPRLGRNMCVADARGRKGNWLMGRPGSAFSSRGTVPLCGRVTTQGWLVLCGRRWVWAELCRTQRWFQSSWTWWPWAWPLRVSPCPQTRWPMTNTDWGKQTLWSHGTLDWRWWGRDPTS